MSEKAPLQDRLGSHAPIRNCYGCGADNSRGLRLKSYFVEGEGVGTWRAGGHHCSYPGFLNGGVACTLIDCHSAWTAFAAECHERGKVIEDASDVPTGWTRAMHVEFLKPTPLDADVVLKAKVVRKGSTSRTVQCSLYARNDECVRAEVTIVFSDPK